MELALAQTDNHIDLDTDQEVIARVLSGDVQAYELLVHRHKAMVTKIVVGKVPRQEAPEVVHEVFIRAFESLAGYRPLKPFANWLATISIRACYDYWRKFYLNREVPVNSLSAEQRAWLEGQPSADGQDQATGAFAEFEAWELLDWALGYLSPEERMALTLVHLEQYSVAEAAELLGCSTANVKIRAFRARRKLRKIIAREMSQGEE